ncbi:hypothetical protein PENPOL_c009G06579 [Penicillium polonicum]|uniref:Uncharacterized protein n=1 Tax=Penicillium polonicum TaxID=60169 RepID=A0A1V6NFX5_PENPO|nr:hypothetical protein PENPOL_c009G06579 [Penicillium polonicum]
MPPSADDHSDTDSATVCNSPGLKRKRDTTPEREQASPATSTIDSDSFPSSFKGFLDDGLADGPFASCGSFGSFGGMWMVVRLSYLVIFMTVDPNPMGLQMMMLPGNARRVEE